MQAHAEIGHAYASFMVMVSSVPAARSSRSGLVSLQALRSISALEKEMLKRQGIRKDETPFALPEDQSRRNTVREKTLEGSGDRCRRSHGTGVGKLSAVVLCLQIQGKVSLAQLQHRRVCSVHSAFSSPLPRQRRPLGCAGHGPLPQVSTSAQSLSMQPTGPQGTQPAGGFGRVPSLPSSRQLERPRILTSPSQPPCIIS